MEECPKGWDAIPKSPWEEGSDPDRQDAFILSTPLCVAETSGLQGWPSLGKCKELGQSLAGAQRPFASFIVSEASMGFRVSKVHFQPG